MIINIVLEPNEVQWIVKQTIKEMECVLQDPDSCEYSYEEYAQLWRTLTSQKEKLYRLQPLEVSMINHLSYVNLLLQDELEDDHPLIKLLAKIEKKTWAQRTHWASGFIDPETTDSEERRIYFEGQAWKAELAETMERRKRE